MRIEDKIHNIPEQKEFRIRLRKNLTSAEATLWKILKSSKFEGRKFRRQHSVGKYVLDFYCPAERLAIELDGEAHADDLSRIHDRKRETFLNAQGLKILRFENKFVFEELEYMLSLVKAEFGWWKK